MKLYGLMLARNEGDIIGDVLRFLQRLGIYEKIFFYDLGSNDDTLQRARQFEGMLFELRTIDEPFSHALRKRLIMQHSACCRTGDWFAIVDCDEFYFGDPLECIAAAEKEGACRVMTYQAEFQFTTEDLRGYPTEDRSLPIFERRKYYLISWSEPRFFRFSPDPGLFEEILSIPPESDERTASQRLLNRHYQYRSPEQIQLRLQTRLENRARGGYDWPYLYSADWKEYVVKSSLLHRFDGTLRFGIPAGVDWERYYNPFTPPYERWRHYVYNNPFLEWQFRKGYLKEPRLSRKVWLWARHVGAAGREKGGNR